MEPHIVMLLNIHIIRKNVSAANFRPMFVLDSSVIARPDKPVVCFDPQPDTVHLNVKLSASLHVEKQPPK